MGRRHFQNPAFLVEVDPDLVGRSVPAASERADAAASSLGRSGDDHDDEEDEEDDQEDRRGRAGPALEAVDPLGVGAGIAPDRQIGVPEPARHLAHRHAGLDQRRALLRVVPTGEAARAGQDQADAEEIDPGAPGPAHRHLYFFVLSFAMISWIWASAVSSRSWQ